MQNGCAGNGTTDDRAALNTLANATISGGGAIYFPPGTYRVSSNITFPSTVALVFSPGAYISADVSVTVTMNGPLSAEQTKIFGGLGTFHVRGRMSTALSPFWWGAAGDGATDDSAAFQAAIDNAKSTGVPVRVPSVPVGYLISTPLNLNDSDRLLIFGDRYVPAANALYAISPTDSSTLIGNTGTGGCIACCIGANGLTLRNLNFASIKSGLATPSTIGLIMGTSNRATNGPGSSAYCLDQIAIYMPETGSSIPIYCNNVNASNFKDIWTVGDNGIVFETANPRGVVVPYGAFGPDIQNDGNTMATCSLLTFSQTGLWMHKVNNFTGSEIYINTLHGGPGFVGFAYAIYMAGCVDVYMRVEVDYFPCVVMMDEFMINVRLDGSTFPSTTPIGVNLPIIALLTQAGGSLDNCHFNITPVMGAVTNANYHYTTHGGNPGLLDWVRNSTFIFDTVVSANVLFANMTSAIPVPLWSNSLDGDSDTITNSLLINNVAMATANYRMLLNSKIIGTA